MTADSAKLQPYTEEHIKLTILCKQIVHREIARYKHIKILYTLCTSVSHSG